MFAEVALPLHLPNTLTYGVPIELQDTVLVGKRVEVSLGKNKIYAGIVLSTHHNKPAQYEVKPIKRILDKEPIVDTIQIRFWNWIAQYYLSSIGDVMNAALPSHFKLMGDTLLHYNDTIQDIPNELSNDAYIIAEALQIRKKLSIQEIRSLLAHANIAAVLEEILTSSIAFVMEELEERYQPKMEKYIMLNPIYDQEDALQLLFEKLQRQQKQVDALMHFLYLRKLNTSISASELNKNAKQSTSAINTLIKKEIFLVAYRQVDRNNFENLNPLIFDLNQDQQIAKTAILDAWKHYDVSLLHGVTGSGKTMIYIDIIKNAIQNQQTALFMLPEIALTTQMVQRLKAYFGKELGVYHSKISQQERIEIWNKVKNKTIKIVIGPRSTIWLPFKDLAFIIIDEEHEPSFKQADPSPRFHARDAAVFLAGLHKCKVLLGSATPSIESMYNVQKKKYAYIPLLNRFRGAALPSIQVVNAQQIQPALSNHITLPLLEAIQHTIHNGQQVILFQNKRGYAPFLVCGACGWIPHCKHCDISMTYHKHSDKLHCHYCGSQSATFHHCPKCNNARIVSKNFGTEKIEEDMERIFPKLRVGRMDWDAAKSPVKQQQILQDFDFGRIDILVGTQMIVKGLDFDNVGLVGILSADSILSFPDFRVNERAYQLMEQVSGRSGRLDGKGIVLIQAHNTTHPIIQQVIAHNYKAFYLNEIEYRQSFNYPPFTRLIKIICKHKKEEIAKQGALQLCSSLQQIPNIYIQGPAAALIARIKTYYHEEIIIKIPKQIGQLQELKFLIAKYVNETTNTKGLSGLQIIINIDPY